MLKTCFLIGHRDAPVALREKLEKTIAAAITEYGVTEFVVGQYGAFDYMAAGCLAEAKKAHPELRLVLLLPYHPAERPVVLPRGFDSSFYPPGMEQVPRRLAIVRANEYMARHCDVLICYALLENSNPGKIMRIANGNCTETGETVTCRLLTLSGKGRNKAVRLLKSGFQILDWFGAREYYEAIWREHNLPSDASHREPRFRYAEAAVLLIRAGVEIRPWWKPPLQTRLGGPLLPEWANFYSSRELKNLWDGEIKKIQYVRMSSLVLSRYGGMAVYNTRDAVMKWSGEGEYKAYLSMSTLAHINTRADSVEAAILFGRSEEVALRTIETFRKSRRYDLRFNSTYRYIYFVPLCGNGIAQLRLLLLPDWNERLLQALFAPSQRSNNMGSFEYDGIVDGVYVFEFFDGDIARLEHFRQGIEDRDVQCRVCCFPFQVSLVKLVLGDRVEIDTYEPKTVMEALGAE